MSKEYDILIIGVTGYTGRLLVEYIGIHKVAPSLRIALGGRTLSKVQELASKSGHLTAVHVDVSNPASVDAAVSKAWVVINLAGPYWTYGSTVVRFCAFHGVHYVDLTGEPYWVAKIIEEYDYLAHKTGACIVPASGFDSIPSDLAAYLSVQTLEKKLLGSGLPTPLDIKSVGSHTVKGFGVSGGTAATMFSGLEEVPAIPGPPGYSAMPKILYSLPHLRPTIYGGFFPMSPPNEAIVRRSWGLRELRRRGSSPPSTFSYHEFMPTRSAVGGVLLSLTWYTIFTALALLPPVRWLAKRILPASGGGPPRDKLESGSFRVVNVAEANGVVAKSVVRGRGDPGYYLTSWMIFESALLLLDSNNLTPIGREGGILTPTTAFGDRLAKALVDTGKFETSSEVLVEGGEESKKTR
ncbi:hypothetical protein FRC12_008186 [Ceratobasidium sp. 428]|nr:hypothetical protein FRC12_008186 [Ceratobasidium sp. 428]